jgi:formate/nitrite transporter
MPNDHDAYSPVEIGARIESAGVAKAALPAVQMLTLAVLAGVFISLGAAGYLMVMTGADPGFGPHRLLGGLVFALGLILVVVGGAELFTGNALMVMAAVDGKIGVGALLRSWGIVYLGNLIGAVTTALACGLAGLAEGPMGQTGQALALVKLGGDPLVWTVKGILCNALVCLAVWLSFSARDTTGKILSLLWPVAVFVLLGLEHSIANMFFFPFAALSGAEMSFGKVLSALAWVTFGNVIGGAGGVALAYHQAFHGGRGRAG